MVTPVQESCPDEEHCNVPATDSGAFMRGGSVDCDTLDQSGGSREAKREARVQFNAQALVDQAEICHGEPRARALLFGYTCTLPSQNQLYL